MQAPSGTAVNNPSIAGVPAEPGKADRVLGAHGTLM
jgi:hypothetical protein